MSSPGVLLLCDFVQAKDATPGKGFSGFLDYQDRPEAFTIVKSFDGEKWSLSQHSRMPGMLPTKEKEQAFSGYLDYQDRASAKPVTMLSMAAVDPLDVTAQINSFFEPGDRSDGIFDARKDRLTSEEMKNYHEIYDRSQASGCPLYRGVISFENDFLREEGIMFGNDVEKRKLKDVTRAAVSTLIEKSHLDPLNVDWTAAIHYNTKNVHVHISLVEKEKIQRRYDRLPLPSIDAAKSKVVNQIVGSEQSILRTKLLREDLLPAARAAYRDHSEIMIQLMDQLPADVRWEYNRRGFAEYRPIVDKTVDRLIFEDPAARSAYEKYVSTLQAHALQLRRFYGDGSRHLWEDFVPDRMSEFYASAGNALLDELQKSSEIKIEDLSRDLTPNQISAIEVGMREGIDVSAIANQEIPAASAWDYIEMQRAGIPDHQIRQILDRADPKLVEFVSWAAAAGADPAPLINNRYNEEHGMLVAIALRHNLDISPIEDPDMPLFEVRKIFDRMATATTKTTEIEYVDFDTYLAAIAPATRRKSAPAAVAAGERTNDIPAKERELYDPIVAAKPRVSGINDTPEIGNGHTTTQGRSPTVPVSSPRALHEAAKKTVSASPVRSQSAKMSAACRSASRRLQRDYEKNLRRLQREYDQQQQQSEKRGR